MDTKEICNEEFMLERIYEFGDGSDEKITVYSNETETVTDINESSHKVVDIEVEREINLINYESPNIVSVSKEEVVKTCEYESTVDGKNSIYTVGTQTSGVVTHQDSQSASLYSDKSSIFNVTSIIDNNDMETRSSIHSDKSNMVIVTFKIDDNDFATSYFNVMSTIQTVKQRFANVFKLNVDDLELRYRGFKCKDTIQLNHLMENLNTLELKIQSRDDDVATTSKLSQYTPVMRQITVKVPQDVGGIKLVRIVIEDQSFVKEWLGGYRNVKTKLEYHHALIQTLPNKRKTIVCSSQSQTPVFPLTESSVQTTVSNATQMWRTDHYISTDNDVIMTTDPDRFKSGKILTRLSTIVKVIMIIIKFVRSLKHKLQENEELRQRRSEEMRDAAAKIVETKHRVPNKNLIIGSTFPIKRDDFYFLYLIIGNWWRAKSKTISNGKSGASKTAAIYLLLEEELELISVIERQRINAKKETMKKQNMHFLETCARPIIFRNENGVMSSIDTLETQQAREYLEIVSSYLNLNVTIEQRIDTLCTLIQLMRTLKSENEDELINLLERECQLLTIGITLDNMKPHRERVMQLFFDFLKIKENNPALKHFRRPCLGKTDSKLYRCLHCGKLKPSCDYNVHTTLLSFTMCMSCEWMKNIGQERINLTPFARILEHVRKSEMCLCASSSVCYVLQPVGMHYLVNKIWGCKSILSDATDLNTLRMVRFRKGEDWSPWNCMLLTVHEVEIHEAIDDVYSFYNTHLLSTIGWRHLRAKNHFLPLLLNDKFMMQSNLWPNTQDTGKFLNPIHINRFAQHDDFEYIH